MQTAIEDIRDAETCLVRGNTFLAENDYTNALCAYSRCLAIDPNMAEAHYNSGVAHHLSGNLQKATSCYRSAIALFPGLAEAHFNLGHALAELFQLNQAAAAYQYVLHLQPANAKAAYSLGDLYRTMGNGKKAASLYKQAIRNAPDYAQAWNNLGIVYRDQNQSGQAAVCFKQALAIQPEMARAWFNLGIIQHKENEYEASLALFEKAMISDPEFAPARWHHALLVPMLYRCPQEIETSRLRYRKYLDKLVRQTRLETQTQRTFALEGIASTTGFYLQYQGADDTALQKTYGDFTATVMAANYPHWSRSRAMPAINSGNRLRIGYVSSLVYGHTIGIFLSGWIKHHDRHRFELFCYHVGAKTDELTEYVRKNVDHFHHIPGNLTAAARQIDRDALHVLIHTDVGMNPLTFQLAALRLAPIQCKGWGHPVTTGLPTMDYYLSSELMEPPDGDAHYSETLVRLPNLALCHEPPMFPGPVFDRTRFNIPGNRFVFLCTQSLFKYLPQHDDLYPKIATQAPDALFVFIAHDMAPVTDFFRQRLGQCFRQYGLAAENHCLFVPKQPHADFLNLNGCADLVLDSFAWSGGKTSLEALWCETPVITCPGDLMRARHTYAFLKRMGMEQAVAKDKDSYIDLAVRCVKDKAFLKELKNTVKERKHLLFNDKDVIPSLEGFLQKQVRGKSGMTHAAASASVIIARATPQRLIDFHYKQGLACLAADQPDQALVEFEKTLSWIPNYLGSQPWFQAYLLDGQPVPHCPPSFMGQVYALLGRCLSRMDRQADSHACAAAALRFDGKNQMAQSLLRETHIKSDTGASQARLKPVHGNGTPGNLERLSLLVVTNATRKLSRNKHLGAPGTGLVEQTYSSLLASAGQAVGQACPGFLCLDRPAAPGGMDRQYEDNLKGFADRFGFTFQAFDHYGLRNIVWSMLGRLSTPYLMLVEHDWRFEPVPLRLDRLLDLFDHAPHIHSVRFNKRSNIISNFDFLLRLEPRNHDLPLLRTVCHSNNPCILRAASLRRTWMRVCLEDPVCGQLDLGGKAFGLEEPLFKRHLQDVRQMGFDESHENWGTYILGEYDAPRRIEHLGE